MCAVVCCWLCRVRVWGLGFNGLGFRLCVVSCVGLGSHTAKMLPRPGLGFRV